MKKTILSSLCLFLSFCLFAAEKSNIFQYKIELKSEKPFVLNSIVNYNGITVQAPQGYDYKNLSLIIDDKDTVTFSKDEHLDINQSNLIIFNESKHYKFVSKTDVALNIVFQYVPSLGVNIPNLNAKRSNCAMPTGIISQQVWRQGLSAPIPGRVSTTTHHCIVHHSAGGNNTTDYTQLVRSYYVQHTQVNGWDDIAYNYLIAPNGSIYAGRDPEKNTITQDNVLGAHFCAKNANTMGICLLGDYQLINPSDTMMSKLVELLTWKYVKDTLNPSYTFNHPYNTGSPLSALAGHRQGCATDCPGNNVFNQLQSVKQKTHANFKQCLPTVSVAQNILTYKNLIYPNPSTGLIFINTDIINTQKPIQIYNAEGRLLAPIFGLEYPLSNGIYTIHFTLKTGAQQVQKLVVYR